MILKKPLNVEALVNTNGSPGGGGGGGTYNCIFFSAHKSSHMWKIYQATNTIQKSIFGSYTAHSDDRCLHFVHFNFNH